MFRHLITVLAAATLFISPAFAARGGLRTTASSPLDALRAAEVVLIADVLKVPNKRIEKPVTVKVRKVFRSQLENAKLRIYRDTRASRNPAFLRCSFRKHETLLLLLRRSRDGFECVNGYTWSRVVMQKRDESDPKILRFIEGMLDAVDRADTDTPGFTRFLQDHIAIQNVDLREGVLYELGRRLTSSDGAFLRALIRDETLPRDLRAWALDELLDLEPSLEESAFPPLNDSPLD